MFALAYRYRATVQAPFREVAAYALPLSFMALEAQYFNLPERKLASYADTMRKRSVWLTDLGLVEPIYHALCSTQDQETALEATYNKLSVVKRRSIEAKAKYLKVMLNSPKPTFKEFEEQYSIHKKQSFVRKNDHKAKRGEWLRAIGLDIEPFCWYPYTTTELGISQYEKTEVAWNDLGLARRRELEAKAAAFKGSQTWGLSWGQIEDSIGFTPNDGERWTQWLAAIGMGRALASNETRDGVWQNESQADNRLFIGWLLYRRKRFSPDGKPDRWFRRRRRQPSHRRQRRRRPRNLLRPTRLGRVVNYLVDMQVILDKVGPMAEVGGD